MSKSKKNKNVENFGEEPFSETLNKWLKSEHVNNVASLNDVFGEKTFAITFLLLMSFPALPIPTGGLSHVFEVIVMLLSLQLIIGRKVLWLPNKWKNKHLGKNMEEKAIPILIKYITKLEKISKPRMSIFLDGKVGTSLFGIIIFSFTLVAL
ncbi:MAG: exopolysaccharide biosynthesis protein, partial [Acidimicrobiia bacterium]